MAVTGAGLEGIVAAESQICFIDGDAGILSYRGFNIHTLAEHATFEEVIFLLWNGVLPKQAELDELKKELVAHRAIPAEVTAFLKQVGKSRAHGRAAHRRFHAVALRSAWRRTCRPRPMHAKAVKLMAQTATIVTTFDRLRNGKPVVAGDPKLGFAANFLYTLTGKKPDEVMEHAFDVALILHADHELNASTFAARVMAATLSDIYSAVTAGIGALKGPLHGGANEDVIKMLLEAGTAEKAIEHVQDTAGEQDQDSRLRPSRLSHRRSARHAPARAVRRTRQAHRPCGSVPHSKQIEENMKEAKKPERERGFLFGVHLLFAGHSDRPVHADLRGQPHVRLDRARAGAISQQPPDPPARRIHGQSGGPALGRHRRAVSQAE